MSPHTKSVPPFFEPSAPPPALPLLTCHTELLLSGLQHAPPVFTQDLPIQSQSTLQTSNTPFTASHVTPYPTILQPDTDLDHGSHSSVQYSRPPTPRPSTPRSQKREVTFSLNGQDSPITDSSGTTSDTTSDTETSAPSSPVVVPPPVLDEGKVPKPEGEAGRPGRGGYNLQRVLEWHPTQYDQLLVSVFRLRSKSTS